MGTQVRMKILRARLAIASSTPILRHLPTGSSTRSPMRPGGLSLAFRRQRCWSLLAGDRKLDHARPRKYERVLLAGVRNKPRIGERGEQRVGAEDRDANAGGS